MTLTRIRMIAILLLAAGYGWAGGRFIPADSPLVAYLFQCVVLTILIVLAAAFFAPPVNGATRGWPKIGLTIFAVLTLLINVLNVLHGATGFGPQSLGSDNSFADLLPIGLIIGGDIVWLALVRMQTR